MNDKSTKLIKQKKSQLIRKLLAAGSGLVISTTVSIASANRAEVMVNNAELFKERAAAVKIKLQIDQVSEKDTEELLAWANWDDWRDGPWNNWANY